MSPESTAHILIFRPWLPRFSVLPLRCFDWPPQLAAFSIGCEGVRMKRIIIQGAMSQDNGAVVREVLAVVNGFMLSHR